MCDIETTGKERRSGLSTFMNHCIEVLECICSYLDAHNLQRTAVLSKTWQLASRVHFCSRSSQFFRSDWTQEPVELALPSNILAVSLSGDQQSIFVCARGTGAGDEALLYIHHRLSGQRSFEELPAAFSSSNAVVKFEGPCFLTAACRDGTFVVFDCDRGMEVQLPAGAYSFVSSASGEDSAYMEPDGSCVVIATNTLEKKCLIATAMERRNELIKERQVAMMQDFQRGTNVGRSSVNHSEPHVAVRSAADAARPLRGSLHRQQVSYAIDPSRCKFRVEATALDTIGSLVELHVANSMLVLLSRGSQLATLKAYFTSSDDIPTWAAQHHAANLASQLFGPAPDTEVATRGITFLFASNKCTASTWCSGAGGGTIVLLDAVSSTLYTWTPRLQVVRAVTLCGIAFSPFQVESLHIVVPGRVACCTTHSECDGTLLCFFSLDGSLVRRIPLKGKSLITPIPNDGEVLVSLWTHSSSPPHPLLEAIEYGIGTLLRFGISSEEVRRQGVEGERKGYRILLITAVSCTVMVASFMSIVLGLVYNGWWLHMQEMWSPTAV